MVARRIALLSVLAVVSAPGARAPGMTPDGAPASEAGTLLANLPPSYLAPAQLPDSLALLPPPPQKGSAAFKRDEAARKSVVRYRGTLRWTRASTDANLDPSHATTNFSCAMGLTITKETTPYLYGLLGKMMIDVGLSTYRAKDRYKRIRPFVAHNAATCSPGDEPMLRFDGSYPSGHSAIGWGWALVLAEINPDRADAILQRGRDFGQSRLVCNVHWQSDIDAGRVIAAATVARLHADADFRADVDAAREEVMRLKASGTKPPQGCAEEAASLVMR